MQYPYYWCVKGVPYKSNTFPCKNGIQMVLLWGLTFRAEPPCQIDLDYPLEEAVHFYDCFCACETGVFFYASSVLPTPQDFIKRINTIRYSFLWNGPDKIARAATINDAKFGGLRLIDVETSIKSLRLALLGRIFSKGSLHHGKPILITCLRVTVGLFYLDATMMLTITTFNALFIANFSNAGLDGKRGMA